MSGRRPPRKKRRVQDTSQDPASPTTSNVVQGTPPIIPNAGSLDQLISALVPALVPAVAQGVVTSLQTQGLLPQLQTPPPPVTLPSAADTEPTQVLSADNSNVTSTASIPTQHPSISCPLGLNVDQKTKGKIWSNEFVDFGTLLGVKPSDKKSFEITETAGGECAMKATKSPYIIRSVNQWVQAFFVFVGLYTEKTPKDAPSLMKYGDLVQKLAKRMGDEAALFYDKTFREWRATNPDAFPWDKLNSEIHSEALAIGLSKSKQNTNFNRKFQPSLPLSQPFRAVASPKFPCHMFNNRGACTKDRCPYTHACQKCGGAHTKKQCSIGNSEKTSTTSSTHSQPKPSSSVTYKQKQPGGPKA